MVCRAVERPLWNVRVKLSTYEWGYSMYDEFRYLRLGDENVGCDGDDETLHLACNETGSSFVHAYQLRKLWVWSAVSNALQSI